MSTTKKVRPKSKRATENILLPKIAGPTARNAVLPIADRQREDVSSAEKVNKKSAKSKQG